MNLRKIFEARSIAVLGVSRTNPFHPANIIYHKNRLRYRAVTYGVNPAGGTLYGDPIFPSIRDLPESVDLAVIAIRAELIPDALNACIQAGVAGAIIISGGFTESGRGDLQERIGEIARAHRFPVIGPNCLGVFSPPFLDTFFLPAERMVRVNSGTVSLVSQSGGILLDQLVKLTLEGVGVSRAVSIGNKAVIDEVAMLQYLKKDRATRVIGFYLEGFSPGRGRAFIEAINGSAKPVVVMKAGKTPDGLRAVTSHTAAIAGDYRVFSELIGESDAIEAVSETEFACYCEALAAFPDATLDTACIVTASGGHGAIASDACQAVGIRVPVIPAGDIADLKRRVSPNIHQIASFANPVDLTGSATEDDFLNTVGFFLEKSYVDGIILLLLPYLPGITPDVGARIAQLVKKTGKPLIGYTPHVDKYGMFIEGFETNGIPVASSVEGAVHMACALRRKRT